MKRDSILLAALLLLGFLMAACDQPGGGGAKSGGDTGPKPVNDSASTPKNVPVDVDVLANDGHAQGAALSILNVGLPSHGSAQVLPGDVVRYTPAAGFAGTDAFQYFVTDQTGATASAQVTVTVLNGAPLAVADVAVTPVDTPVDIDVLANDSDPDGDALDVTASTTPTHGTVVQVSPGMLRYTPPSGFQGVDSFVYTASDGAATHDALVDITIGAGVNAPPVAVDDSGSTRVGLPLYINVLGNDSDADGDALAVTAVGNGASGTVSNVGHGVLKYSPVGSFTGSDSFIYTVSDGRDQAQATVHVSVVAGANNAPVATDDTAQTDQRSAVVIDVLANDTDADNDPLALVSASTPARGTVQVNGTTITYTPHGDLTGLDSFMYIVEDNQLGTHAATVTVEVLPRWSVASSSAHGTAHPTGLTNPVYGHARDVWLTDVDGDQKLDVLYTGVTGYQTGTPDQVTVLRNQSTQGSPATGPNEEYESGGDHMQMAVGDLNGDGLPDVAVNNCLNNAVSVYLNDPTQPGTYLPRQMFMASPRGNLLTIGIGITDFDSDGKNDLVLGTTPFGPGTPQDELVVLINTTPTGNLTASFTAHAVWTGTSGQTVCISIADLNGDGKPDVVAAQWSTNIYATSVWVFLNTTTTAGTPTVAGAPEMLSTVGQCWWVATGDFNGDGQHDIVSMHDGTISLWINNTPVGATQLSLAARQNLGFFGGNRGGVQAADVNGDGKCDIVTSSGTYDIAPWQNTVYVFLNHTEPGAASASFMPRLDIKAANISKPWQTAVGDVDGDGVAELVVGGLGPTPITILRGQIP